ncbi:MAG: homoserine dehydrogenase [Acutalibacteraceae bacterium]
MKIAIAGYGVVGRGTHELLLMNRDRIAARAGEPIEVKYVLDPKPLDGTPAQDLKASGIEEILSDPEVKLLVEAIGGVGAAYEYVRAALESGRSVVTPNKQLVAEKGAELLAIARSKGVGFLFEASVAGGTPVLHPISQCLWANDLDLAAGILNGTTNYILTKMVQEGAGFEETLRDAQRLGYAEADPTADIEGIDACRKTCILADLLSGRHTDPSKVFTQGITKITAADVEAADLAGYNIKLIGQARRMPTAGCCAWSLPPCCPNPTAWPGSTMCSTR